MADRNKLAREMSHTRSSATPITDKYGVELTPTLGPDGKYYLREASLEAPMLDPLDPFMLPKALPAALAKGALNAAKGYGRLGAEAIARGVEGSGPLSGALAAVAPRNVVKNEGSRFSELLKSAPRDKVGGIKVLGGGSDEGVDKILAGGRAPLGDHVFWGGRRGVDPMGGDQTFMATVPTHGMYYASLPKYGSMSVYRHNIEDLPTIANNADTDGIIELLLGHDSNGAALQKPSTWGSVPPEDRRVLEQINDVGGVKLQGVDDYGLGSLDQFRGGDEYSHAHDQLLLLPKRYKDLEKRAGGGAVESPQKNMWSAALTPSAI